MANGFVEINCATLLGCAMIGIDSFLSLDCDSKKKIKVRHPWNWIYFPIANYLSHIVDKNIPFWSCLRFY